MVTLSLDTSVLVDLMRGRTARVARAYERARESGRPMIVSPIVLHELVSGALASAQPERELARIEQLVMPLGLAELTPDDAFGTGRLRAELRGSGRPIGDLDTLIAGQALARGWAVVTGNLRHFALVEGLAIVDWSTSDEPLTMAELTARLTTEP
jgi:tRNA(fMet)-specific endonuclease VapC